MIATFNLQLSKQIQIKVGSKKYADLIIEIDLIVHDELAFKNNILFSSHVMKRESCKNMQKQIYRVLIWIIVNYL